MVWGSTSLPTPPPAEREGAHYADIRINNYKIKLYSHVKYLGILDEVLSWNKQIESIYMKLARANGILSKLPYFVPKDIFISVYYSLFRSVQIACLMLIGCIQASKTFEMCPVFQVCTFCLVKILKSIRSTSF